MKSFDDKIYVKLSKEEILDIIETYKELAVQSDTYETTKRAVDIVRVMEHTLEAEGIE